MRIVNCPLCGFNFVEALDRSKHNSYCKRYLKACVKFDTILHHETCGAMKRAADQVLSNENSSTLEQADAVKNLLDVFFSQSVTKAGFNLSHPNRNEFYATMLRMRTWDGVRISEKARKLLLRLI